MQPNGFTMKGHMTSVTPHFDHKPARVQGRLLLESICVHCGNAKIVSAADGSLAEWETRHVCTDAKRPAEKSLPPGVAVGRGAVGNL